MPRPEDPRHGVIVAPAAGKTLGDWGTPTVKDALEATAWPRGYRKRHALQDNSVKRMIDHGALKTHDGRTKRVGPDRHQHRAREKLAPSLGAAQQRGAKKAEAVTAQQDKVAASASRGHGTRLVQRPRTFVGLEEERKAAQHPHTKRSEHASARGPSRQRADRDFRTQTIMTFRTLLLENALLAFLVVLCERLQSTVRLDCLLRILFARRGARMEPAAQIVDWVHTAGVSVPYRRLLTAVVAGLCAMDLREQGKPMHVRLKDIPP